MPKERNLQIFAWSLSSLVAVLAIYVWGNNLQWQLSTIKAFDLFPIFGLVAFSLMWSHYIVSAVRQYWGINKQTLNTYIEVTSLLVLVAICAHPGILEWTLWKNGLGLPPINALRLYDNSMRLFVTFGMVSLLVFLAYEFRRWFSQKPWWKFVGFATDAAMLLIFVHSLKLGRNLQAGWFKLVWWFYGVTLILALIYLYWRRYGHKAKPA